MSLQFNIFFIFGAACLLLALWAAVAVPETHGKSIDRTYARAGAAGSPAPRRSTTTASLATELLDPAERPVAAHGRNGTSTR